MYINSITVSDFKSFMGIHTFDLSKINLVSGQNGIGKSTLALHSILFAVYGYSENPLDKLQCRFVSNPKTYVCIDLTYNGDNYIIKRSIPTHISIKVNGVESTLANNTLKQKELERLFKDTEFFRRFRMIDIKDSINILEQGNSALRKTLVDLDDSIDIGTVRTNLMTKQNERNRLNKDTNVLYTHAPLQSRLTALQRGFIDLSTALTQTDMNLILNERLLSNYNGRRIQASEWKTLAESTKHTVNATCHCPTCQQVLPNTNKNLILTQSATTIKE